MLVRYFLQSVCDLRAGIFGGKADTSEVVLMNERVIAGGATAAYKAYLQAACKSSNATPAGWMAGLFLLCREIVK